MDGSGTERAGDFRGRLFRKYVGYFAGLLSVVLLASGATGLYFSYRDTRTLVDELQREKARAAAARIEQYLHTVENQLRSAVALRRGEEPPDPDQQYLELLRLAPAVADAAWIDAGGRERVRVSRIARDMVDGSNRPLARTGLYGRGGRQDMVWGSLFPPRDGTPCRDRRGGRPA